MGAFYRLKPLLRLDRILRKRVTFLPNRRRIFSITPKTTPGGPR